MSRSVQRRLLTVLGALVAIELCGFLGLWAAVDGNLERPYSKIRGDVEGAPEVIFVAIDESTVDQVEGPPMSPITWHRSVTIPSALARATGVGTHVWAISGGIASDD